ncbi:MAG: cytochrome C oxidase subunit IV [Woeseia sp.]|nr:cytochrome C oxidase subunit IV [Chloroflexota bacterium]MBJ90920.1 cytochrome C oxidase subunit IV [Woeseia sp.]MCH2307737.1 cytochrome C oxidase subunit IV family protein [SAR202 cluster bacterium]|tara:strand:- start:7093 stop:7428 length:336 start_codon:yes stop_codon:yes gene_type:complete
MQETNQINSNLAHSEEEVHTGHPTALQYFKVAMILSIVTALEFVVFYFEWLGHWIIPILTVLSVGKFALVVMYYMHLKYDSKLFTGMFFAGFVVATGVIFALMALFSWFVF